MEKTLRKLFPEVGEIQDRDLQDGVLSTWTEGVRQGGWHVEDLTHIPFTLLIPDCPVHLVAHTRSVTQIAIRAGEVLGRDYQTHFPVDRDVLVAGGLLHDVGKLLEYRREGGRFVKSENGKLLRHPFSGAGLATRMGLPAEVVHVIATHAKEGDGGYRSPEAVLVHHADFMVFDPLYALLKK